MGAGMGGGSGGDGRVVNGVVEGHVALLMIPCTENAQCLHQMINNNIYKGTYSI